MSISTRQTGTWRITANSQKLYKLKATTEQGVTGLGITLKVMAGDKIDIWGKSYYFTAVTNCATNNKNITTLSILTGLLDYPGLAQVL